MRGGAHPTRCGSASSTGSSSPEVGRHSWSPRCLVKVNSLAPKSSLRGISGAQNRRKREGAALRTAPPAPRPEGRVPTYDLSGLACEARSHAPVVRHLTTESRPPERLSPATGCSKQFRALYHKQKHRKAASGRLPEAASDAVRHFPTLLGAFRHAIFAEQRLKLPEAARGWRKALRCAVLGAARSWAHCGPERPCSSAPG
eukprot:1182128-Alexandrium_andersonii.AAC.1